MFTEESSNTVFFEQMDMPYVNRVGFFNAVEEAQAHIARTKIPFIRDTHQLAGVLHLRHRDLFRVLRNANRYYVPATLKKKNGGIRRIHAPMVTLKETQRYILTEILDFLPISIYAKAYRKGSHLTDNANPHCRKRFLLKMDLQDFFPSIRFDQVLRTAFHSGYFPRHIGAMLTTLCCFEDVLPQGAPTSPALSNVVMRHFDDVFGAYCERQGLSYTRYCDDITVSGDKPLYAAYAKARALLEKEGFTVNEKKTRFVTNANRQTVTGLTVNEAPHVPREYRRALRQELHYLFTYGPIDAIVRGGRTEFYSKDDPEYQAMRYLDSLEGRVQYVLSAQPDAYYWLEARAKLHALRRRLMEYAPHYRPFFE